MERRVIAGRALRAAPAHGLLDCLRGNLTQHFAATRVDLLLVDYGLTKLRPFVPSPALGESVAVESSPAGRAFSAQQPYLSFGKGPTATAYLPVTVRGDRCGVLVVALPLAANTPETIQHLAAIAEMLGHALRVAERHTDVYREARRERPLTLPAEMQWQLTPGRSCSRDEFELQAHCEPAYASDGHLCDWSASVDGLTLVVANGTGSSTEAAQLNSLALNAIRNARRAGLDLASQAILADQALYGQHRGSRHLSALMTHFDLRTGEAWIVDAGSPSVWRSREGSVERVELERQLPLGMFEDTLYTAQSLSLHRGDRLVFIAGEGEWAAADHSPDEADRVVSQAITAARPLACAEAPEAVLREISGHRPTPCRSGLVLCLDWYGVAGRNRLLPLETA